jgi:hypothetical protein
MAIFREVKTIIQSQLQISEKHSTIAYNYIQYNPKRCVQGLGGET